MDLGFKGQIPKQRNQLQSNYIILYYDEYLKNFTIYVGFQFHLEIRSREKIKNNPR